MNWIYFCTGATLPSKPFLDLARRHLQSLPQPPFSLETEYLRKQRHIHHVHEMLYLWTAVHPGEYDTVMHDGKIHGVYCWGHMK